MSPSEETAALERIAATLEQRTRYEYLVGGKSGRYDGKTYYGLLRIDTSTGAAQQLVEADGAHTWQPLREQ